MVRLGASNFAVLPKCSVAGRGAVFALQLIATDHTLLSWNCGSVGRR
jgi:hypothetical protein